MGILTLTTDWGTDGAYVGAFKGRILSGDPTMTVVDLSHRVQAFNSHQAAFVVRNAFRMFPPNTVHIIGVGGTHFKGNYVACEYDGHYFLGYDDGIWDLLFDDIATFYKIEIVEEAFEVYSAFAELAFFSDAAIKLANGGQLSDIGEEYQLQRTAPLSLPAIYPNMIRGHFLYFDGYGNAISNISKVEFEETRKGRDFEISLYSKKYSVEKINKYYFETRNGEILAIFGFAGLLEMAIANGNIKNLLNLNIGDELRVIFKDKEIEQQLLFG